MKYVTIERGLHKGRVVYNEIKVEEGDRGPLGLLHFVRVRIDGDGVHIRFATFSRDEAEVIAEKITRILKRLKGGTDAKFKAAFKVLRVLLEHTDGAECFSVEYNEYPRGNYTSFAVSTFKPV
ncbi:MAG: hypothetical protein QXH81_09570 [Thermofilaceae archaeon]